jgi:histidyl-tRNA synthetase
LKQSNSPAGCWRDSGQELQDQINSLGCPKDKLALSSNLRQSLQKEKDRLCPDCRLRLENNVLRILDCKNETCREIVSSIGLNDACLCPDCRDHFNRVTGGLQNLGIPFEISPLLVRGLDYYNRTVFEITHGSLGSQDAIGAGGRYNNLIRELGGPDTGGIGFAFGVERVLLASEAARGSDSPEN